MCYVASDRTLSMFFLRQTKGYAIIYRDNKRRRTMKKKWMILLLATGMVLGSSMTAYAIPARMGVE